METANQVSVAAGVDGCVTDEQIPRRRTVFDFVRWMMLALWLFVMAVAVSIGSYSTQLRDLESELDRGGVTSVTVTPGMPAEAEGATTQSVYWRSGWLNHRADVVMVTPGDDSWAWTSEDNMAVRTGYDIANQLAEKDPALLITRVPERMSGAEVYGFEVPSWLLGFTLAGAFGTFVVLVSGPQPWRATRWAWFWLMTTVIGAPLFLVLAGPTPPLRSPREQHRRLTGGRAFIIALVLQLLLQH